MKLISRITALLMAGAVVCSTLPANAWAVEATDTEGLCEHHPEHTAECGYAPAEPGQPCTFVCEICNSQEGGEPRTSLSPTRTNVSARSFARRIRLMLTARCAARKVQT